MTIPFATPSGKAKQVLPVAYGRARLEPPPLTNAEVAQLVAPFAGKSVAQCHRGPAMVMESGTAVIIVVTKNPKMLRVMRHEPPSLLFWRWDGTPSAFVSFSLFHKQQSELKPQPRWMGPTAAPVVQHIRSALQFAFVVATPDGRMSNWVDATLGEGAFDPAMRAEIEHLFALPVPGIPLSRPNQRLPDANLPPPERDFASEVPYAADPRIDFWRTFTRGGPWNEREPSDIARGEWAIWAGRHLADLAQHLRGIAESRQLDGTPPLRFNGLQEQLPLLHEMVEATAGLAPDLARARAAALAVVHDPKSLLAYYSVVRNKIIDSCDSLTQWAFEYLLKTALLDPEVTDCGARRPSLDNDFKSGLVLNTLPVDMATSREALHRLWDEATDPIQLIDASRYWTPDMLPVEYEKLVKEMGHVRLDCAQDDARGRIDTHLYEAHEARQWSIPWGARVALNIGPFTALRIFEIEREFICQFLDDNDRCYTVSIGLRKLPATCGTTAFHKIEEGKDPEWNEEGVLVLSLIAAAVIRDFLVVEERDSVFTSRPFRRRRGGSKIQTIIYLPRTRYTRPHGSRIAVDHETLARAQHSVHHHLRRVGTSSQHQQLLARQYGVFVPAGYTFVRPHERGGLPAEARKRIYRSRSASAMLFEAVDPGPNTTSPAWFKFERDCAKILRARDMTVVHYAANRDADGGMDLFAIEAGDQKVVVQCKCWALTRPVGPDVVRELAGTMKRVDVDSGSVSRGVLITTSRFTDGAVLTAKELAIEIIDGAAFARLLAALPSV